jgi:hypothetical protein
VGEQRGTSEEQDAGADILKNFRDLLVREWPERTSMDRVLYDAGLQSYVKHISTDSKPAVNWHQALKKLDTDNKLLKFARTVQGEFDEPQDAVVKLIAFEEGRLDAIDANLQTRAFEAFTRLLGRMTSATSYTRKLREPVHADLKDLAAIKDYLSSLYVLLDELRDAHKNTLMRQDAITQADEIERRMNHCVDSLQLYRTMLQYARPPDDMMEFGAAEPPGGLSGRASDEIALLRAKSRLRNALNHLVDAGEPAYQSIARANITRPRPERS